MRPWDNSEMWNGEIESSAKQVEIAIWVFVPQFEVLPKILEVIHMEVEKELDLLQEHIKHREEN